MYTPKGNPHWGVYTPRWGVPTGECTLFREESSLGSGHSKWGLPTEECTLTNGESQLGSVVAYIETIEQECKLKVSLRVRCQNLRRGGQFG